MLRSCSLFVLFSWLLATAVLAEDIVVRHDLDPAASAWLAGDGVVNVGPGAAVGDDDAAWLRCLWDWPRARRPLPGTAPFTAVATEGDRGGHRGFSTDADDDGDGRTDEDPLDGRDNDGDGAVDEDYAAISHRMGVWSDERDGVRRHLATYHWIYPHLQTLLAVDLRQSGGATIAPLRLVLGERGLWQQIDEVCLAPDVPATGPFFYAALPAGPAGPRWLGLVVLDEGGPRGLNERVHAAGNELLVPLRGSEVALAIAVGATRLQVLDDLAAAARLAEGITDPVTGRRVSWLPAAVPPTVPASRLPSALLRDTDICRFELVFGVAEGHVRRFDPDLFATGGQPLGEPTELVWSAGEAAPTAVLAWPESPDAACDPYTLLGSTSAGTLTVRFRGPRPAAQTTLHAVLADGRTAELALTVAAADTAAAALDQQLSLSPRLLANFPNPFRSSTRVRFQVPATAAEAFVWEGDGPPPFDPQERLPFADGSASVRVTVYSLEGKEVARLFAASVGPGDYEATWDGRDRIGRTVASGAYICKLEIENWSVTKQLIFVR